MVFSFPAMLLISSTAGVIGGLAIICGFVVLQLPIFVLFKKAGWLPNVDRKDPRDEDQESKRTLHF